MIDVLIDVYEMHHFQKFRPREASEMFHSSNSAQNSAFRGLWVHSLKTSDKVLKYGENNKVDFFEHPTVVKRGSVRIINIYAAVPDVAYYDSLGSMTNFCLPH